MSAKRKAGKFHQKEVLEIQKPIKILQIIRLLDQNQLQWPNSQDICMSDGKKNPNFEKHEEVEN
jgi:hypothetical protein